MNISNSTQNINNNFCYLKSLFEFDSEKIYENKEILKSEEPIPGDSFIPDEIKNKESEKSEKQEYFVEYFIPMNLTAGLAGVTAVKLADFLRSTVNRKIIPGFICGSDTFGDHTCRAGSVGDTGIHLCAERIAWIQPIKPVFRFLANTVSRMSSFPSHLINSTENSLLSIALSATGEELFCRGLIQRVCIRNIQSQILKRLSPNHEVLVDHPIVKITRIAATSIIFGLMHTSVWECGYGGTIPEIAGGIIFGALAETKYGLTGSTLAHITANLIINSR